MTQEKPSTPRSSLHRRPRTPGRALLRLLAFVAIAGLGTGCGTTADTVAVDCCEPARAAAATNAPAPGSPEPARVSEQSVLAVLWYQYAAECRALYYQACNIARARIDEHLQAQRRAASPDPRPNAIIVDIDETVLDNSAYNTWLITNGTTYRSTTFQQWVNDQQALVLPGLSNLFRHAHTSGVEILYVSNRRTTNEAVAHTIANLHKQGLPPTDAHHVFLRTNALTESKDDRRDPLLARYNVILLMGDNLADFHHDFESAPQSQDERKANTDRDAALFGTRYIVLPNPMYGTWENALYPANATNKSTLRHDWVQKRAWGPGKK